MQIGLKIGYGNLECIPLTGWILRINPVFLELIRKNGKSGMSWVVIYFSFKMKGNNLARFQNSLRNSFSTLEHIIFMRWIFSFLEFSEIMENRVKITYNKLEYVSLVGWIVRFYPIFLQNSWKNCKKTGTKIECDLLGCIPLTGWVLRFYPVFPGVKIDYEKLWCIAHVRLIVRFYLICL